MAFLGGPGAARFALAPGYLIPAPPALDEPDPAPTINLQKEFEESRWYFQTRPTTVEVIQGLRASRWPLATLFLRLRRSFQQSLVWRDASVGRSLLARGQTR
jgi:hypothetical protein